MTVPAVAILLATYNGAQYLAAQLDSFAAQSHLPALVLVSDDGSTDATRDILADFAAARPDLPLRVLEGPKKGSAANFISMLAHCPDHIDMVCFSDQDDIWLKDKTARAVDRLREDKPQLYCARTWVCDTNLGNRHPSRMPRKPPGFRNALVQNIAAGNTIMLNRAALDLARAAAAAGGAVGVTAHDWWLYQLMTGAGAQVIFDPEPVLLYRQHSGNLVGANHGALATLHRLRHLFTGTFQTWNTLNLAALEHASAYLTDENRTLARQFSTARTQGILARLAMLRSTGFYRQGKLGQASLWLAAALGRL